MIYDWPPSLDNLEHVVDEAIAALTPFSKWFDTIAVRGMSGVLVGSPVSIAMGKKLVIVRKPTEHSHSCRTTEGVPGDRYIFLDDFVAEGNTKRQVILTMANDYPASKNVGFYLYFSNEISVDVRDS